VPVTGFGTLTMNRLLHSVRLRLTIWYAGVLALALALFAVAVYVFVVRTLQTSIDEALKTYGHQVSRAAVHQVRSKPRGPHVKRVFVPSPNRHQPVAVMIVSPPVKPKTARRGQGVPVSAGPSYKLIFHKVQPGCNTISLPAPRGQRPGSMRMCYVPVVVKKGKPVVSVEVAQSLTDVDKTLERLRLALILGIPFALLLAGAGGRLLASRALEPVDRITQMARSISATDLSRRINLGRQDELGRLAGTFDEMIDRLERAFQEQRQLTADVSHELRSPLTVLEAQTTLALRRSRNAAEYRQVLASVQEEVERMSVMVNQLLMLARADAGQEPVIRQPLCVADVAQPVVDGMRPLVGQKGVHLDLDADPNVWIQGDPDRLRQLLLNLLDNALRHTPAGGRVDVRVARVRERAVLAVADTGEGIAAEDLPHIFQRFYRGDRARHRGMGNSGLGLAIAKWVVEAHGGRIDVSSTPGCGATFTVTLPVSAAVTGEPRPDPVFTGAT